MKTPLKICKICGLKQEIRVGAPPKCWDYDKCSMCFHENDDILPIEETAIECRYYTPLDFYLDKYTPQEMEKME